jgi:serine acetyltransferase
MTAPLQTPNMRKNFLRRAVNRLLHLLARNAPGAMSLRPFLHRLRGVRLGKNVFIGDEVYLENEYPERVEIGDNTVLSVRSLIIAHTQGVGAVSIGRNVWIGPGAMVICAEGRELTIGDGAVISNGSTVSHSVAPGIIMAPPRSRPIGRATFPLTGPDAFARFVAGLRPLPREGNETEATPGEPRFPGDP